MSKTFNWAGIRGLRETRGNGPPVSKLTKPPRPAFVTEALLCMAALSARMIHPSRLNDSQVPGRKSSHLIRRLRPGNWDGPHAVPVDREINIHPLGGARQNRVYSICSRVCRASHGDRPLRITSLLPKPHPPLEAQGDPCLVTDLLES